MRRTPRTFIRHGLKGQPVRSAAPLASKTRTKATETAELTFEDAMKMPPKTGFSAAGQAQKVPFYPQFDGLKVEPRPFEIITKRQVSGLLDRKEVPSSINRLEYLAAASVLPMRTNNYVVEDLINWSNIPDDPIFNLVFPQPGMLEPTDLNTVASLLSAGVDRVELRSATDVIRDKLNPHPANQKQLNVPKNVSGEASMEGMQHKYRETALFFPTEGQYCHAFCTYCFRWAQFVNVGTSDQFASKDALNLRNYLAANKDITDLLVTGGDPMVMSAAQLSKYLEPLLEDPELDHLQTIRIGTKSVAYWPYRFVTDDDSADMLRLLEKIVRSGRHVSIMGHYSHPVELSTAVAQECIRQIRSTGAQVRGQAPLICHVNDDPHTWGTMWRNQVRLGVVPYYMFVERDTGARHFFEVPLYKAHEIYSEAIALQSGLARTARGPSMSATPGKVQIVGTPVINGEKVFALKFIQGRNPKWTHQPFFAQYDETATWLDNLKPAFGEEKFFFEDELKAMELMPSSSGVHYPSPLPPHNLVFPRSEAMAMWTE